MINTYQIFLDSINVVATLMSKYKSEPQNPKNPLFFKFNFFHLL